MTARAPGKMSEASKERHLRVAGPPRWGTLEVAKLIGVTWRTVYRWLAAGKLPEPARSAGGRRIWTPELVAQAMALAPKRRKKDA